MVSSSTSSFVLRPDQACLAVVLVRSDELRMVTKGMWFQFSFSGCWARLSAARVFGYHPFSTNLFDYYATGIAESGGVEIFNDLIFGRFLALMFSFGESIADKVQETSLEGSPEVSAGIFWEIPWSFLFY
ncbi:hypothetical protein Pyn_24446 [Prunus yedoensis var. nudiflora]|uniref:Uncharacterized protein n=1 Tax=Prunus yedoensis var. nudiflora TaxID=2094558 RepID=A0A314YW87_PRUYE|nr:hypothetical protein Pyn_24446 [Prunus yedoensis var. nudiflora]